ncbi:MAG: hypothetical protein ACOCT7_02510 [Candidatus Saliniplasma sp.]
MKEGKSLSHMSKELDLSLRTLKAIVDSMEHEGLLIEVNNCESGCSMCPLGCSPQSSTSYRRYMITEKGTEFMGG